MANFGEEAARLAALRRATEMEWVVLREQLRSEKQIQAEFGFTPTQGYSRPYKDQPHMPNTFWQRFSELTTRRAKLQARNVSTEFLYRNYLREQLTPLSPMEWKSFTFDADTSDLDRWQKGKLTRLFKSVMRGKSPLRRLTDYMEELGIDFDYREFRRSYRK